MLFRSLRTRELTTILRYMRSRLIALLAMQDLRRLQLQQVSDGGDAAEQDDEEKDGRDDGDHHLRDLDAGSEYRSSNDLGEADAQNVTDDAPRKPDQHHLGQDEQDDLGVERSERLFKLSSE